jgi:hypothetical protein
VLHQSTISCCTSNLNPPHIKNANFKIINKAGFFVKMLPNSMMLEYSRDLLRAMNSIASDLPVELTANLAIVASQYSAKENPSRVIDSVCKFFLQTLEIK